MQSSVNATLVCSSRCRLRRTAKSECISLIFGIVFFFPFQFSASVSDLFPLKHSFNMFAILSLHLAPHQPRLDWQMWFAALGSYQHNPWFIHLIYKMLKGEPDVLNLLGKNPFPDKPPIYIRSRLFTYHYTVLSKQTTGIMDGLLRARYVENTTKYNTT